LLIHCFIAEIHPDDGEPCFLPSYHSEEGEAVKLDLTELINLKEIIINHFSIGGRELTSLNLSGCDNLKKLFFNAKLTTLSLFGCSNLEKIMIGKNNFTSIDFLKQLSNPDKLKILHIYDNNIQPTTLNFLRPFVNLEDCKLGGNSEKNNEKLEQRLQNKTYNKFYGSLEPIKNLTKLE